MRGAIPGPGKSARPSRRALRRQATEARSKRDSSDGASRPPRAPRAVVVRTHPLSGPAAGLLIGVSIERSRSGTSLTEAAVHFTSRLESSKCWRRS